MLITIDYYCIIVITIYYYYLHIIIITIVIFIAIVFCFLKVVFSGVLSFVSPMFLLLFLV